MGSILLGRSFAGANYCDGKIYSGVRLAFKGQVSSAKGVTNTNIRQGIFGHISCRRSLQFFEGTYAADAHKNRVNSIVSI